MDMQYFICYHNNLVPIYLTPSRLIPGKKLDWCDTTKVGWSWSREAWKCL